MCTQNCPVPFEILAVNNNSKDNTRAILENLAARLGDPLRFVIETRPEFRPGPQLAHRGGAG